MATTADLGFEHLKRAVVDRGLCTGCGTCLAVCPAACLSMRDREPALSGECTVCGNCSQACPGEEIPLSALEQALFGRLRGPSSDLGVYQALAIGHSTNDEIRVASSSGGMVTALLVFLLESEQITGAVCVGYSTRDPLQPIPVLCRTVEQVVQATQSKLAFTAQNAALVGVSKEDRLALVGLPCQVTGLRKAQILTGSLKSVELALGLCCMSNYHIEATRFLIEEVLGVPQDQVASVAVRDGEHPGTFAVTTTDGRQAGISFLEAAQYYPMFRPHRCIACTDWSAELADLSFGDYWADPQKRGFSSIVVRTDRGRAILDAASLAAAVHTEPTTEAEITKNLGFQFKKRGNTVFVREAMRHGLPHPRIS